MWFLSNGVYITSISNAQTFSENENFKNISMSMERDILQKHKIKNRSKKKKDLECSFYTVFNFSIFLQFLIEI
jgi:hypothetical protein